MMSFDRVSDMVGDDLLDFQAIAQVMPKGWVMIGVKAGAWEKSLARYARVGDDRRLVVEIATFPDWPGYQVVIEEKRTGGTFYRNPVHYQDLDALARAMEILEDILGGGTP